MASLQDIVKKNKQLVKGPGGQLSEETQENVQTLAGKAGLQSAPLDPAGTATIGGNPHQVKMAGSPAQVDSALRMAQDPSQSLATVTRTQQSRTEQTSEERQGQEKSQALQDLGQLGDRVSQLIEGQRAKLVAQAAPQAQQQVAAAPTATGLPQDPAQLTALKNDLKTFQQNPNDMHALLRINQALGRTANSVLKPEEIAGLYESSVDAIAKAGADTLDNDLQVEDLIALGNFPYQAAELSSLLNVPEADITKYSVVQLREALNRAADEEFSKTQQLEQQATSGVLGSAERAEARGMAREASATGQRASEADVARLEQQIQNADVVQFGGTPIRVGDLLKDETISGIISDYLGAPEGSEVRKNLEATEPQLVQFIKTNEALLGDAAAAMGKGATEFGQIQKDNAGVGQIGSQTLDPELLKAAGVSTDMSADRIDTSKVPLLAHLKAMDPAQAEQYAKGLALLPKALYQELAKLSPEELTTLGFENPAKAEKVAGQIQENWGLADKLAAVNPQEGGEVLNAVTGGQIQNPAQAQDLLLDNIAAGVLGLGKQDLSFFDEDGDGRLDPSDKLIGKAQAATPRATLKDILGQNVSNYKSHVIGEPEVPQELRSVFDKVKKFASDGNLTPDEIRKANLTEDEIYSTIDGKMDRNWDPATQKALRDQLYAPRQARTEEILSKVPTYEQIIAQWRSLPPGPESKQQMAASVNSAADSLAMKIAEFRNTKTDSKIDVPRIEEQLNYLRQVAANFK